MEDIFLFQYQSARDGRSLGPQFVQLDLDTVADLRSVTRDKTVLIFEIGYPTRFSSFEINRAAGDAIPPTWDTLLKQGKNVLQTDVPPHEFSRQFTKCL